jgi:hypothetical protein
MAIGIGEKHSMIWQRIGSNHRNIEVHDFQSKVFEVRDKKTTHCTRMSLLWWQSLNQPI